ncbi:site-specific integrase [Rhodococcus sp. USK10]|uniref:site-specific integrase n=1 Tax=Rhodococcus sp. USK10 TaxID=2789739 RepID=UPI0021517B2E|nr:site-specific integrase [Rhodococcus sp. USK10]
MSEEQRTETLRAVERDGRWSLTGPGPGGVDVVNDYLGYLADRMYSPRTVRAYAFDLLAFARWLVDEQLGLDEVTTEALLRFLAFCRATPIPGRPGGNVYSIRDRRNVGYAATTINRRLAAISGLFSYRGMRDGAATSRCPAARLHAVQPQASRVACSLTCANRSDARS